MQQNGSHSRRLYVAWLAEVRPLRVWVCQAQWIHGGIPVSRSERTDGRRSGPSGNNSWQRDQCLLLLSPSDGREERRQTLRHHLRTPVQYGCHQHELPVCGVTTLSFSSPSVFVVVPLFNIVWQADCSLSLFPFLTLTLLSVSDHLSLFFLRCHSASSISAASTAKKAA